MENENNMMTKIDSVSLGVYIVNKDWDLLRVINTQCELYREENMIPVIRLTDNMIMNILNTDIIPFYDINKCHFNFYCNNIISVVDYNAPITSSITIELLEVDNTYILLSPGIWIGGSGNIKRHRLCDDAELYNISNSISIEALSTGNNFINEFINIINSINNIPTVTQENAESTVDNAENIKPSEINSEA